MSGNIHQAMSCEYCNLVLYSKGALTRHLHEEHWKELEENGGDK